MATLGYIVYGVAALWALIVLFAIRRLSARGVGATRQMVNILMLFLASLAVVPTLSVSPLHVLWMFPISFFLGQFSTTFPLSLLSIPGKAVLWVACAGLDMVKVVEAQEKRESAERLQSFLFKEGLKLGLEPKQAKAYAEEESGRLETRHQEHPALRPTSHSTRPRTRTRGSSTD